MFIFVRYTKSVKSASSKKDKQDLKNKNHKNKQHRKEKYTQTHTQIMFRRNNTTTTNNNNNTSMLNNNLQTTLPIYHRKFTKNALRHTYMKRSSLLKRICTILIGLSIIIIRLSTIFMVRYRSNPINISSSSSNSTTDATSLTRIDMNTDRILSSINNNDNNNNNLNNNNMNTTSTANTNNTTNSLFQLSGIDYEKYTVRINTWKRNEQLQLSIEHHLSCPRVALIQIVWCIDQGQPPLWLNELQHTTNHRVYIEIHTINSLNERFRILTPSNLTTTTTTTTITSTTTAAILSIDDDVIRPCIALDAAFAIWTRNPDRQVGFDARVHTIYHDDEKDSIKWKYGYMSTTERMNQYSITLTRFSFQHRYYLQSYMNDMPKQIRDTVEQNFNCEDIAMSLYISYCTNGKPPLLADYWIVKSQIKMYVSNKISGTKNHKYIRDDCINTFATILQLKDKLLPTTLRRRHSTSSSSSSYFQYGAIPDNWNTNNNNNNPVDDPMIQRWKKLGKNVLLQELAQLRIEASKQIYIHGLIENTQPWKDRFQHKKQSEERKI